MNKKTVVLISYDDALSGVAERLFSELYSIHSFRSIRPAVDYIYNAIPNVVIMDMNGQDAFALDLLNNLKDDPIFHQLPVLAVLDETQSIPQWDVVFVEDYIKKADFENEGPSRVSLSILRSERISEVNPLTKLPGNVSINKQIQARLDRNDIFFPCICRS
jgi:response regulator RpfG family c-di-GMP phosphodiesterase